MEGLTLIPRRLAAACSHARAHGCPRGPSSLECDASSPYVWIPGGAASTARGRAAREEVSQLHYRRRIALPRRATEVPYPRI
jgi:uncharacterized lipoprotein YbaY